MIRIERLGLARWGHFREHALELGDAAGRLQLVYGDNEAGKSTTLRAVEALLFGIPDRTADAHVHAYADLSVRARLRLGDRVVEVERRKGRKNTLLDEAGLPFDVDPVAAALHGLTAEVYAGLFSIDHGSLVEGGEQLLAGHGEVGESLFSAAAGTGRLHALLRSLESEAEALFKPRGRNDRLNVALAAHREAQQALKEATVLPRRHRELREAVVLAATRREELDEELRALEAEGARLARLQAVLPMLARHASMAAELDGLGDVPELPADAGERRAAAVRDRDGAARRAAAAREALEGLRARRDQLEVDEALLAGAALIRDLHGRVEQARAAEAERAEAAPAAAAAEARLRALLDAVRPGLAPEDLDVVAGDEAARERLEACLEQRAELAERARGAAARRDEARAAADEAASELAAAQEVPDTGELRAALRAARAAAGAPAEAARHQAAAREAVAAAAARFARLSPRPQGDGPPAAPSEPGPAALAALPVPPAAAVERLEARAIALTDALGGLADERRRLAREGEALADERAALPGAGEAPSADDLREARAARQAAWAALRAEDSPAHVKAYESAVAEADAVADRRFGAAELAARADVLAAREAALVRERAAVDREVGDAEQAVEALAQEWDALWAGLPFAAPALGAGAAWLAERGAILALLDAERAARAAAAEALAPAERHAATVRARLEVLGVTCAEDAALDALAERAEDVASELEARAAARERLQADAAAAARAAEREAEAAARAAAELAAWASTWDELRAPYGTVLDVAPDLALATLRRLDTAAAARGELDDLRDRATRLAAQADAFAAEVEAACAELAPDLAGRPATAAALTLLERLEDARRAQEACATLDAAIAEREQELRAAEADHAAAQATLAELLAAAGCDDLAALPAVEARAARAAELRDDLRALEHDVAGTASAPFAAVAAEADAADPEPGALAARAAELEREVEALRAERDAVHEAEVRAIDALGEAERSDAAARAAEDAAHHLAEAREAAEAYAVRRAAVTILRRTIETYRKEHQGPMLERAGQLFPQLTCEAYSALEVDWDGEDHVLVGVAADGCRRRVEGMSDGTREQLFLALRIAAIERYVAAGGPVPVVFDDVFLESDDRRSARILGVLADLARRTQVLVFTHHRHLVALADETLSPAQLVTYDLATGERRGGAAKRTRKPAAAKPIPSLAEELEGAAPPLTEYAQGVLL